MREIRDIHEPFIIWLREREIPYIYHRPDRKSGIHKGHPDFTILWCNRVVMIECKTPKGKLSPDQVERIAFLQKNGCRVEIARSLEECCEATRCILTESGRATDAAKSFPDAIRERFAEAKAAVAAVGTDDGHEPSTACDHVWPKADDNSAGECCAKCGMDIADAADAFRQNRKPPVNGTKHQFLGKVGSTMWVLYGTGKPGDITDMVRVATPQDMQELRQA